MRSQFPKDTTTLRWTQHAVEKMRFYGLSEARVKRVIENPERREEGIAEDTTACMQTMGGKRKTEIWVMYQQKNLKSEIRNLKSIISVWRYPGRTKPRDPVPVPKDSLKEIYSSSVA